jgi:plasmid stabilization system protein ParE
MGSNIDYIQTGYWQMESASHVIYSKIDTGILIVRALHERMDFKRRL